VNVAFYIAAAVAVAATAMVVTRRNLVHALLYLIISFFAVAVIFFTLGAPFVAALEVIVYAGAIIVLFVFVVMMLNLGPAGVAQESAWMSRRAWLGAGLLALTLLLETGYIVLGAAPPPTAGIEVAPKAVAIALYGPYLLIVELASLLLLAGLVGAYHLGRRSKGAEDEL
jgi:NADH-quinone oxidoreductase subunit J